MSQVSVIKFRFSEEIPALESLISELSSEGKFSFEVENSKVSPEVATILTFTEIGIIFACVKDKADLAELMIFLKRDCQKLKNVVWDCVVVGSYDRQLLDLALNPLGISAIYPLEFDPAKVRQKVEDFLADPKVPVQIEEPSADKPPVTKPATAKPQAVKPASAKTPEGFERMPALNLEADIWLLEDPAHCRRTLNTWVINITGPSTKIGTWTKLTPGVWEFKVTESEKEVFGVGAGKWCVHAAAMPKLSWEEKRWTIQGKEVELYYQISDEKHFKIQSVGTALKVAQNSLHAEMKRDLIRESFSDKFVFSSEGAKSSKPKVFDEAEKEAKELEIKLTPPAEKAWGRKTSEEEDNQKSGQKLRRDTPKGRSKKPDEELFSDDVPVIFDDIEASSDSKNEEKKKAVTEEKKPKASLVERKKKLLEKKQQIKKKRELSPADRFKNLQGKIGTQAKADQESSRGVPHKVRKPLRQKLPKLSEDSLDAELEELKATTLEAKMPAAFSVSAVSGDQTISCHLLDVSESYVYIYSERSSASLDGPLSFAISYEFGGEHINLSFEGRVVDETKIENGVLQLICPDESSSERVSTFLSEIWEAVRPVEDHFYSSKKR